ncbi:MAG TPA: hypothetical protein VFE46_15620 [Pirellulales bacterium]|jgi:CheY-like chemotaxis protein|nr:hypothetical protein [Pirellulales bacterium]
MSIAFLTSDLVFPSRVAGVAQQLGWQMFTAATADALLEKMTTEAAVVVILDLNTPQVDPATLVPCLKALPIPPRAIIAFGPHVHEAKLAAAQAAGCNFVLTRGQFDAQMQSLLAQIRSSSEQP